MDFEIIDQMINECCDCVTCEHFDVNIKRNSQIYKKYCFAHQTGILDNKTLNEVPCEFWCRY